MFFALSEEQQHIKDLAEKFAQNTIQPIHERDDKEGRFRREIVQEMGRLGFWGAIIPEEYGGNNAGFLSAVLITEAISVVSPAYAGHFLTQTAGTGLPILKHGTPKQKSTYLPALVSGEILGCFAATEPDAGSDMLAMRMSARAVNDGFVLTGTKTWITNASEADIGLIFAVTDKNQKRTSLSCFCAKLKDDPHIRISNIEKLGQRCVKVGEISFEEAEIPKDALIGGIGEGYDILTNLLNTTRLFAGARALGVSAACLEKSIDYARTRVQFGNPIGKFQMIQQQIADMFIEHEASRMLVYQAAANRDAGVYSVLEVSTAKLIACECAVKAADTAMKIFGAYAYSMEYPIQRYLRDSRALILTEGSSNIQRLIIARNLMVV